MDCLGLEFAMHFCAIVVVALGPWVAMNDPFAQLQAALKHHQSALAFFSCRVEYEKFGDSGFGFYVRTPETTRIRFEGKSGSSDTLASAKEQWILNLRGGGPYHAARRVSASTFHYSQGNPWGHVRLNMSRPNRQEVLELADALPLLAKDEISCERAGEDILLTVTFPNVATLHYTFSGRYGYLPTKLSGTSYYRDTTTEGEAVMSDFEELAPGVFFARRADYRMVSSSPTIPENNKDMGGWARLTNLSIDPKAGEKYPEFKIPTGVAIRDEIDREYYQLDQSGKRLPVMKDGRVMKAMWGQERDEAKYLNQSQATQLANALALGPTGFNEPTSWPWVLGGSAVGAIVAVVVWYLRRRWFAGE